jgi:hypothetical protein
LAPIESLPGLRKPELLTRAAGGGRVLDLLLHLPERVQHRPVLRGLASAVEGQEVTLELRITGAPARGGRGPWTVPAMCGADPVAVCEGMEHLSPPSDDELATLRRLGLEGRARLADFGLATLAGRVARGGSPYNASPQQLRGEPAAAADDIYAFGALLYELLCGHPPWYPDVTPDRVLHEPVPPLVPRHPAPERLRQLALRLLAKSPEQRPASATALRSAAAIQRPSAMLSWIWDSTCVGSEALPVNASCWPSTRVSPPTVRAPVWVTAPALYTLRSPGTAPIAPNVTEPPARAIRVSSQL